MLLHFVMSALFTLFNTVVYYLFDCIICMSFEFVVFYIALVVVLFFSCLASSSRFGSQRLFCCSAVTIVYNVYTCTIVSFVVLDRWPLACDVMLTFMSTPDSRMLVNLRGPVLGTIFSSGYRVLAYVFSQSVAVQSDVVVLSSTLRQ